MSRIWRIALMWLLVVAVPAQGIAAAAMFHCEPAHRGADQTAVHGGHAHDHSSVLAIGPHSHPHDHGAPAHSHGDDAGSSTTPGNPPVAKTSEGAHKLSK